MNVLIAGVLGVFVFTILAFFLKTQKAINAKNGK